jgi:uncharacterized protein YndB with AHSA1/START domain
MLNATANQKMKTSSKPGYQGDGLFWTQRVLPFAPEAIFGAFRQPELLARWWGPKGFTNTFETFEFNPGGRWKFVMHGPDGANYPNENVFEELEAPQRIVIRHASQPHFVLTVTLAEQEGGTLLDWRQQIADSAVAERIQPIVEPANEENLDRLQAVLAE